MFLISSRMTFGFFSLLPPDTRNFHILKGCISLGLLSHEYVSTCTKQTSSPIISTKLQIMCLESMSSPMGYISAPFLAVVFASVYSATVSSMDIRLKDECRKLEDISARPWKCGVSPLQEGCPCDTHTDFRNKVKHTLNAHTTRIWSASSSGCFIPKISSHYSFRRQHRKLQTLTWTWWRKQKFLQGIKLWSPEPEPDSLLMRLSI